MATSAPDFHDAATTGEREQDPPVSRIETLRRIQQIIERVDLQDSLTDAVEIARACLQALIEARAVSFLAADLILSEQADSLDSGPKGKLNEELISHLASSSGVLCCQRAGKSLLLNAVLATVEAGDRERLLAVSVSSPEGDCMGVFIALREADAAPFGEDDVWAARQLARYLAGPLSRFRLNALLGQHAGDEIGLNGLDDGIFRRQAVEHHAGAATRPGEPLRLSPRWIRWCYPVLLVCLLAGLSYSLFAEVTEYATGPAVVQLQGMKDIVAPVGGSVSQVLVTTGEVVERGQALVRFYDAHERTEARRLQEAFELELVKRLRDPHDPLTERSLTQLRAQLNAARLALQERTVNARTAGTVIDVRARPGQVYQPGEVLLSLNSGHAVPSVIALIPGAYRPQLEPGMPMRLELHGYRYAYQELRVDSIGEEIVGPEAARRYLGADIAGAIPLAGPVVPVRATLEGPYFAAGGKQYHYFDGMLANAEVGVDSERLLFVLIPGLKRLTDD